MGVSLSPYHAVLCLALVSVFSSDSSLMASSDLPLRMTIIQDRAKKAAQAREDSVRALIDSLFDKSILHNVPESVRTRLTRADLAFRRGGHRPILEKGVVTAVNSFVDRLGGPALARISLGQLRGSREIDRFMVPFIGAENGIPRKMTPEMSPAEAVFVLTNLAEQKLFNPEYQVPPQEWAQKHADRKARALRGDTAPVSQRKFSFIGKKVDRETASLLWALENDLQDETGELVYSVHAFLDELGIER